MVRPDYNLRGLAEDCLCDSSKYCRGLAERYSIFVVCLQRHLGTSIVSTLLSATYGNVDRIDSATSGNVDRIDSATSGNVDRIDLSLIHI